jgi:16S rRNA (cytosine1407-C5)-methyltransferase
MVYIPQAFIEHIKQQSLNEAEVTAFVRSCQTPLRKSIRVNTSKISTDEFIQRISGYNWQLTPIPWCADGFWLEREPEDEKHKPLGNYIEHLQGLYYIQEASSMLPPVALASLLSHCDLLLDMAAAPGSKTTQLANYLDPEVTLVANELSSSRLKGLHSNIQRCGLTNICLTHLDGRDFGERTPETFDAILLDAPCGGEGTIRKDPDAMKNWSLEALDELSRLQKQLIESAYRALKPGGILVYSTCTLSREENQQVCEHLIHHAQDIDVCSLSGLFEGAKACATEEGYLHVFPHIYDSEGFFVAAFRKQGELNRSNLQQKARKNWPFQRPATKVLTALSDYLERAFNFDLSPLANRIYQRDNSLWLFPAATENLTHDLKIERAGCKLAELHKQQIRIHHDFAIAFGNKFHTSKVDLNAEQAVLYCQGRDLMLNFPLQTKGDLLVCYGGHPLGLAKSLGNRLKNNLPRALVRDNPVVS